MSDEYLTNLMSQFLPTPVVTIIEKGAASCTYNASNYLARGCTHLISALGDYALQMPEGLFNTAAEYVTGNNPNVAFYNNAVKPFVIENNPFNSINNLFTNIIASSHKPIDGLTSFQASELIAPVMVSLWSSKKCAENTLRACSKIKILMNGKSSIIEKRNLPTGCIFGNCTTAIYTQENISIKNLLLDIVRAGGWFTLSHYSTEGILEALTEVNPASAANIVLAIRIGSFGVPLFGALSKYLANRQTTPITKETTQLVEVVMEKETNKPDPIEITISSEEIEDADALKLLDNLKNFTQLIESDSNAEIVVDNTHDQSAPIISSTLLINEEVSKTHSEISIVSDAPPQALESTSLSVEPLKKQPQTPYALLENSFSISSSKVVSRIALTPQAV